MTSRRAWIIVAIVAAAAVAGVAIWLLASGGVSVPDVTGKSEAEARGILEDAGLALGDVSETPSAEVAPGLTVSQDPAAGTEVDEGTAVSIAVSSGPETAEVPDVTGKTEAAAQQTLTEAGFVPESTGQFDTRVPEGVVMAQLPAGAMKAYVGSSVGILVSKGAPDKVEVPDVTGLAEDDATDALAEAGLEAVAAEAYDEDVPEGQVADQDPPAGKEVPLLSEVLISVSLGEGTAAVAVPDVVGDTEADAVDAVEAAIRRADATWSGALTTGSGAVSAMSSGAFTSLPVTWAARTESSDGRTSPEELVAAAHAACFSMALSGALGRAGTPADRLEVSAAVTFDKLDAGWRVVSSALTVRGWVPGATAEDFVAAAEATRDGCPISVALAGNVELSVEATLEG